MAMKDPSKLNDFLRRFIGRTGQLNKMQASVAIAFYVMLSLFPILVTISTLLPYFNIDIDILSDQMDNLMPEQILESILPVIDSILTDTHAGVLSLGILATIWSASKCVKYLQSGMDRTYGIEETRVFITSRLFSLGAFLLIILLLILFMVVFAFGEPIVTQLFSQLKQADLHIRNFKLIKWGGTFLSLFLFFWALYFVLPNIKQKIWEATPGALFSAIVILLGVQVYSWYLGLASNSLSAYGVLSAFFVLMIWVRMLSLVLLMGALLNAMLFEYKHGKPQPRKSRIDIFLRGQFDRLLDKLGIHIENEKTDGESQDISL
jgi:membrane protein